MSPKNKKNNTTPLKVTKYNLKIVEIKAKSILLTHITIIFVV